MKSYYDELRFYYGETEAFSRYEKQNGKFIIASANEPGTTRLFMRSLNPIYDLRQRNGWWNTFTITNKPCEEGTFICKIQNVSMDKDGYPIFIAEPIIRVDEDLNLCDEIMYIFYLSGMFTEEHINWSYGFNFDYLMTQVDKISTIHSSLYVSFRTAAAAHTVQLFIDGKVTKEQIIEWLHEPTEWEKEQKAFEDMVEGFFDTLVFNDTDIPGLATPFSLLSHKCAKFNENHDGYPSTYQKVEFIKDLQQKYENAVRDGHIQPVNDKTIWSQIEAYLVFDQARKEANKAAKKAAKKAKKAAKKEE